MSPERRTGGPRRATYAIAAVFAMVAATFLPACSPVNDVARPLALKVRPIGFSRVDPQAAIIGKLRFRGGLELRSRDPDFGGISALLVSTDGARFVAVTDKAHWLTGNLGYEKGNLVVATGDVIAPMLDESGKTLVEKDGDAEGLASADDGNTDDLFVSFEVSHRIWRYPFGKDGVYARPSNFPIPPEALKAPRNGGLEGITRIGDGMLLAVTEHYRNRNGNYRAWMLPFGAAGNTVFASAGAGAAVAAPTLPAARPRAVRPVTPYSLTDVRRLPDGDLLLLERRYDPIYGVGIQLRRIAGSAIEDGTEDSEKPLDGEVLAQLTPDQEIDNMEGLSVRRGERGETLVYMVSDDNFNRPMQRTLLMMFELLP